jgi:hypothetical protein
MPELACIARSPNFEKSRCLMLIIGEKSVEVGPLGYGWDPFGDLVRAVLVIVTNGKCAEITLPQGPIFRRLIIERLYGQVSWSEEARVLVTDRPYAPRNNLCPQSNSDNPTGVDLKAAEIIDEKLPFCQSKDAPLTSCSEEVILLDATVHVGQFAREVLQSGQAMWDDTDKEQFHKTWSGVVGFPFRALFALKSALANVGS